MSNTETVVQTIVDGNHVVRTVTQWFGDGESWIRHVIMPRELCNLKIRKIRARNKLISRGVIKGWLNVLPDALHCFSDFIVRDSSGMHWANRPWIVKKSRKFVVMTQRGGMDI